MKKYTLIIVFFIIPILLFALPYKGKKELECLQDSVEVFFDDYGVPHIYANNIYDLVRVQGYMHARERLWSMELTRRATEGRLSEIFGESMLDADIFLRTLGFNRMIDTLWTVLTDEQKKVLEAYSEGVNAFIKENDRQWEFKLLGVKPEPWNPKQSLGYIRLMAWDLTNSYKFDYVLWELYSNLDSLHFASLIPHYPDNSPRIIPAMDDRLLQGYRETEEILKGLGVAGSNSWAITKDKSVTGNAILCNDPHLSFGMPILWYEVHLNAPGMNLYGVSLPSLPFTVIGHTDKFAWGLTNVMADDADFIIEEVNPEDTTMYKTMTGWKHFVYKEETIYVKKKDPYILRVKITDNGPVVSSLKKSKETISFKWTAYKKTNELMAMMKLPYVKNWREFLDAVSYFQVPGQNFLYADINGNIGYVPGIGIPKRPYKNYILPMKWDDPGALWTDFVPFDSLPMIYNPNSNFLITANNPVVDNYPYYITMYWEPDQRSLRINNVLSENKKFNIDDMKKLQYDFSPPINIPYRDIIVKAINPNDDIYKKAKEILSKWDGKEDKDSPATTIYYVTLMTMIEKTFADEMDTLYGEFISTNNLAFRIFTNIFDDINNIWFDNVYTSEKENRDDIISASFIDAVDFLQRKLGKNPSKWQWGKIHTITFDHPFGEKNKILKWIFSRGPYSTSGSPISICKQQWHYNEPYNVKSGASTRQVINLADIYNAYSVIPTGNSGRIFNSHYDDQIKLWLNGEYHEVFTDRKDVEKKSKSKLLLIPKKDN